MRLNFSGGTDPQVGCFKASGNQKTAGLTMVLSDKTDFKLKAVIRDQKRSLYNDRGVNSLKGLRVINIYAPNF